MNFTWRLTLTPLVEVDLLQMSDDYVAVGSSSERDRGGGELGGNWSLLG